ncbi:hypothetical protein BS78_01G424200 [Paspalum vaginatum]|nr:hypothetical protein BS78_01G424200 [Paspalum vaginatum]
MFVVGASYRALLEIVAARCCLEYAALVTELAEDGTILCAPVFFWVPVQTTPSCAYEQAALQAISYLQSVYTFLVVDYNFQGLVLYRGVARAAISVGARAARFASLLLGASPSQLYSGT